MGQPYFQDDAPGVLGFDDSIEWYCGSQVHDNGRQLALRVLSNGTGGTVEDEKRRRLADGAQSCAWVHRNVLFLFGNNVHGTGAVYNSCRNLEWQMCAAMGKLPGQRSATIEFAREPSALNPDAAYEWPLGRPLDKCGGYSPMGCGPGSYSNDDIFYLEVCLFSKICSNNDELFRLKVGDPFHCRVSERGFRDLQALLTSVHL